MKNLDVKANIQYILKNYFEFIFSTHFQVASQFRVILANMNTQFTGIFGHIVSGIEALDKVADIGGEGGRPEKIALVTNCGVYKG